MRFDTLDLCVSDMKHMADTRSYVLKNCTLLESWAVWQVVLLLWYDSVALSSGYKPKHEEDQIRSLLRFCSENYPRLIGRIIYQKRY